MDPLDAYNQEPSEAEKTQYEQDRQAAYERVTAALSRRAEGDVAEDLACLNCGHTFSVDIGVACPRCGCPDVDTVDALLRHDLDAMGEDPMGAHYGRNE